jgi:hypothetical protein
MAMAARVEPAMANDAASLCFHFGGSQLASIPNRRQRWQGVPSPACSHFALIRWHEAHDLARDMVIFGYWHKTFR